MKKRGKMLAAALAAVGAVSIIAGGCSGENKERLTVAETTAMIKETTADQSSAAPESQAAEAESQAETESVPQVTIDTETQERYADDGKTLLVEGSFDKVGIEGAGYEKVAAAVEQWSEEEKGLFAESMEALVKTAGQEAKDRGDEFIPYSTSQNVEITRLDANVISFRYRTNDYTGGAHGNYGYFGATFDAQTGNRLSLADLVNDKEAFKQKAVEYSLENLKGRKEELGLFDDYESAVRQDWENSDGLSWYLDAAGITVVFNPYEIAPYAAGSIYVTLPYSEFSEEIKEDYRNTGSCGVGAVPANTVFTVDGADGVSTFELSAEFTNEDHWEQDVVLKRGNSEEKVDTFGWMSSAYLIRDESGKSFVVLDGNMGSDAFVTYVYDVTNGNMKKTDETDTGVSIDPSAVNVSSMRLRVRFNICGTYEGTAQYHLDSQGKLVRNEDTYAITSSPWSKLTVKSELPVEIDGKAENLAPGEMISITGTDGEKTLYFTAESSGKAGQIHFTRGTGDEAWKIYIDGVQDEEYFESLPYAG